MRYRDAGVDIDAMDAVKSRIAELVRTTYSPQVLSDIGLFGSLVKLPRMREPVLVASCDSLGTKALVARMMGRFDTVGIDMVNHSVNDILTLGARPLFLLDYIGHADLGDHEFAAIMTGLVRACRENSCPLVGGEIAMMPDVYRSGDFDLAGFIVGVVEQRMIADVKRLAPGDLAVGIPSSGLHTNGYTLARKVLFDKAGYTVKSHLKGLSRTLGETLLSPHRSYLKPVYPLLTRLKAIAHITGGGLYDNIARLLPEGISVLIRKSTWRPPAIFRLIQKLGNVPEEEMYRTFNMGVGMVLFVAPRNAEATLGRIRGARVIGKVVRGTYGVVVV